jgi:hypothetical protein
MPPKSKTEPGTIFEIPLDDGSFAYGMVIKRPLAAFFNLAVNQRPSLEYILSQPVAFRVWIMDSSLGSRGWKTIGNRSVPSELAQPGVFYKYDLISHRFSVYSEGNESTATKEQCIGLECAAVWSSVHIQSRLSDHIVGRPNAWVESLSAANRQ